MLLPDMMIDAIDATLQSPEIAFDAVRRDAHPVFVPGIFIGMWFT